MMKIRLRAIFLLSLCNIFKIALSRQTHWTSPLKYRGGGIEEQNDEQSHSLSTWKTGVIIEEKSYIELLGPKLLQGSADGSMKEIDTVEALNGKHVALYLTSQAVEEKLSEATEEKQGGFLLSKLLLTKIYELTLNNGHPFEMVYVPVQDTEEKSLESFRQMPWLCIKPDNSTAVNIIQKAGIITLPSVIVLGSDGNLITSEGIANMSYFPDEFPWVNKPLKVLLGSELQRADKKKVGADSLDGKVVGVYFSADWCAPCKQFTPMLIETYETLQKQGKNFEVVYVSSDKNETEYESYSGSMPWLSISYGSKYRSLVQQMLDVRALPTLLIFDENSKLISANGRTDILKDIQRGTPGEGFPWRPKPLADLNGVDKSLQTKILDIVKPIAEARDAAFSEALENGGRAILEAPRKATFLAATEIDQLSTTVRKLCKLEEIQGKWKFMKSKKDIMRPRVALLSLLDGKYSLYEDTLDEGSLSQFLQKLDSNKLEMIPFDVPEKDENQELEDS